MKLGFGIIGLGIWGETHAKTYADYPQVDLVKVCDLRADRARKIAKQYGARGYCTDYREVLADDTIQAVSIVTPDFAHTDVAIAAAKAGKHILVEKPLATSVADCQKIIAAARKAGVKLMVDFHNRFNPPIANSKTAIEKGELGDMRLMTIRLNDTIAVPTDWLSWAGRSSVLWFLGSHCVDVIRWLFADEVKRVFAVSRSDVLKRRGVNTPDFFQAILEMKRGGVASLENCWIVSKSAPVVFDFKLELIGSDGTIYLDLSHHRAMQKYTKAAASYPDVMCLPTVHGKPLGFCVESIRHFIECVIHDREPIVTGEDGLAATKVLCAIQESAQQGAPVLLR